MRTLLSISFVAALVAAVRDADAEPWKALVFMVAAGLNLRLLLFRRPTPTPEGEK